MDYSEIRKLSLKIFLGFLGLTALIAIVSVLLGELGQVQVKILATTFTISAASICSMACAAFTERKKPVHLGLAGILLSICAAVLVIAGMWSESNNETYWKTTVTVGVLAIALAHAFLLNLPELDKSQKWVQLISSITIAILALQIIGAVWGEINQDVYYRFLAVVAIVVALETLAIPILLKLRKRNGEIIEKLVLVRVRDDIYRDESGKEYQLREIGH